MFLALEELTVRGRQTGDPVAVGNKAPCVAYARAVHAQTLYPRTGTGVPAATRYPSKHTWRLMYTAVAV